MHPAEKNKKSVIQLWLNWVMVVGALSLLVIMSLWLSPVLVTLLAFAMQTGFYFLVKSNARSKIPVCFLLPHLASVILFFTGLITLLVNFLYSRWMIYRVFDMGTINEEIPFIVVLIISPVTFIVTGYAAWRGTSLGFCEECKARFGTPGERGFLGNIFSQEGKYQVRILCNLSALLTLASWVYYAVEYVNVNLNSPDRFVFFWAPIALFVCSIVYMGLRYGGLWNYYSQDMTVKSGAIHRSTLLRYLIFWDNYLCVLPPQDNPDMIMHPGHPRYDSPGNLRLPFRERMPLHEAKDYFSTLTHMQDVDMRLMYENLIGNTESNVFHYLVFLTDEQKETLLSNHPSYQFIPLSEIDRLLNSGQFDTLLSAEIVRLHTIAMAWKTYDSDGRRLYRIKHYVPTFRLRDIKKWDVDYNDSRWLTISRINEDKPFFRFRRWWNKFARTV